MPASKLDRPKFLSLALALGVSLAGAPLPALAAPADDEEIDTEKRAMAAYNDGKTAYDAGDYSEALELFLDAQSLYPSPVFHYNIGLCHEALENWEQAVISYEAYLRSYQSAFGEDPEDKVNTENKIERLNERIEFEKQKAEDDKKPTVIIQPPPEDDKPEPKPGRGLMITGGVLTGVGVGVAAVGGAVFGTRAADFNKQVDAVYNGGNPDRVTLEQALELDAGGRSAQLNQILMISIGGAVGITGIALLAVGLAKKKKAGGAEATVTPSAGPDGAGIVIRGRF